jgi:hypothetical protein
MIFLNRGSTRKPPSGEDILSARRLRLYVRKYGSDDSPGLPLLCLAGLTRNGRDFHSWPPRSPASAFAAPCLLPGLPGPGPFEWDKNW